VIDKFRIEKRYYFNVGEIPNTGDILASIINRHHGAWGDGAGWGEAHHTLICGQNGSGKTVWLLVLLVGKLAQHRQMGLLIPDLVGDISSQESRHNRGDSSSTGASCSLASELGSRSFQSIRFA